jgi:hypothetical protein
MRRNALPAVALALALWGTGCSSCRLNDVSTDPDPAVPASGGLNASSVAMCEVAELENGAGVTVDSDDGQDVGLQHTVRADTWRRESRLRLTGLLRATGAFKSVSLARAGLEVVQPDTVVVVLRPHLVKVPDPNAGRMLLTALLPPLFPIGLFYESETPDLELSCDLSCTLGDASVDKTYETTSRFHVATQMYGHGSAVDEGIPLALARAERVLVSKMLADGALFQEIEASRARRERR